MCNHDNAAKEGALTFDEAILQVTGMELQGAEAQPVGSVRDAGDVMVGDLPLSVCENTGTKLEQFVDIIMQHRTTRPLAQKALQVQAALVGNSQNPRNKTILLGARSDGEVQTRTGKTRQRIRAYPFIGY